MKVHRAELVTSGSEIRCLGSGFQELLTPFLSPVCPVHHRRLPGPAGANLMFYPISQWGRDRHCSISYCSLSRLAVHHLPSAQGAPPKPQTRAITIAKKSWMWTDESNCSKNYTSFIWKSWMCVRSYSNPFVRNTKAEKLFWFCAVSI